MSFPIISIIFFRTEEFFHAAWAICLYGPRTSVLPRDSKSCGSFLFSFFAMVSVTLFFPCELSVLECATGDSGHVFDFELAADLGVDVCTACTASVSSDRSFFGVRKASLSSEAGLLGSFRLPRYNFSREQLRISSWLIKFPFLQLAYALLANETTSDLDITRKAQ